MERNVNVPADIKADLDIARPEALDKSISRVSLHEKNAENMR